MTLTLIAVFGVFQVILILMHAVIYQMLGVSFGWSAPWLAWLFAVLSITFVTASVLAHLFCNRWVKGYYRFSTYWFGLCAFLYVGALDAYFVDYFSYAANAYISPLLVGLFFMGGAFITHCYATWHTTRIKRTRINVALPHLPAAWRGKKIVFVSDVHLGAVRSEGFAQKVAAAIATESPEMVLVGGDIFDGVKCHAQALLDPFTKLRTPRGTYFASGNHEYIEDTPTLMKEIEAAGMRILHNEVADIDGLQIAGVDWKENYKKGEFEKILETMHIDPAKPSILMRHEPSHLNVAADAGVSLTLCGHTHAGQIFPLRFITRRIYRGFDYGLKRLRGMMVYTSSGVGTWGPPLRFGTRSEIVVITLE